MSVAQARSAISAARSSGTRLFYITGGEVFLFFDDLLEIVEHVASLGCRCVVETNAFWATSKQTALTTIRSLAERGMDVLALSVDNYHDGASGIERSVLAAEAAREAGVLTRIMVISSECQASDERILRLLDERRFPYFYETVMLVGRANPSSMGSADLCMACDSIGPTVFPDGNTFSCTGADGSCCMLRDTPLYVGNVFGQDAEELLARERDNPFARAIDKFGHAYLAELIRRAGHREDQGIETFSGDVCGYCRYLLTDKEFVDVLKAQFGCKRA